MVPPDVATLRDRLARPRDPAPPRIEGWQPCDTRVILAAPFKAGKSTLVGNLVRSLVDGDLWLERHRVTPLSGTLALVDFEMGPWQLTDWLGTQGIRHDDRCARGAPPRPGDDLRPAGRPGARDLGRTTPRAGLTYLVVDCLRPILDALGLDEHHDAGRFLVALDALLREAAIPDCLVVHHFGHVGERSRGDSRMRDWPDVEWRLVRQDEEPSSVRYPTVRA